ncbi:MAG TPA: hypothetical protein PK674_02625 [Candidatus Absconditabacterales bacterium]|nr:hypothetical protein [Candidatus Absconditabacterales bacterium]HOQ79246.1 hypothetical protein [Candidatus Absconditabacterales bacterium]HPK28112.1 hypothetical protein [Candidatus Absconditabacterales bacterium]
MILYKKILYLPCFYILKIIKMADDDIILEEEDYDEEREDDDEDENY